MRLGELLSLTVHSFPTFCLRYRCLWSVYEATTAATGKVLRGQVVWEMKRWWQVQVIEDDETNQISRTEGDVVTHKAHTD